MKSPVADPRTPTPTHPAGDAAPRALLDGPAQGDPAAPGWFAEGSARAWERFLASSAPARNDERWRFSDLARLALEPYRVAPAPDRAAARLALDASRGLSEPLGQMVFCNDRVVGENLPSAELRGRGVIWEPLDRAAAGREALVREHFMAETTALGSDRFSALHRAMIRTGAFVYVPPGVELEAPLENFYWLDGEAGACFPHTLVIAAPGSRVTVIDHFRGTRPDAPGFACAVNDLVAMEGARIHYVSVQEWGGATVALQLNSNRVGRDATVVNLGVNLGGRYARSESVSRLLEPGARSDMLAVALGVEAQHYDLRTLQDHLAPRTSSDLLYKNALDDSARAIFSGLIRVEPGAHHTDAYQKVRNLLLSDEAEANSLPGLEIMADEVRCTHGATSGQVHEDEMFYMRSRGIRPDQARRLIVFGFLNEVIERLPVASAGDLLRDRLEAKLARA